MSKKRTGTPAPGSGRSGPAASDRSGGVTSGRSDGAASERFGTRSTITIFGKRSCSTCADALRFAQSIDSEVVFRDTALEPLSTEELEALIGPRPIEDFTATRSPTYKALGLAAKKPGRAQLVALMREHVNLLRRPIFARGDERLIGFREKDLAAWIARSPESGRREKR